MLIIGEKINGTRRTVNKAVIERDGDFISRLAIAQVEAGADVLDINAGTEATREANDMAWLINIVQDSVQKPLSLDSPNPAALAAGLRAARQVPIINSISAEEDRLQEVLPLVAKHGCRVLALALGGITVPETCEERMTVVRRLFQATRAAGVPDENMFVDSLVMTVATNSEACNVTLATMRAVKAEFPQAHLTAGLSNVSFGLPARTLLNRAFLTLAIEAGLDSAIMDPMDRGLMETLFATEALLGMDRNCGRYCRAYRDGKIGTKPEMAAAEKKLESVLVH